MAISKWIGGVLILAAFILAGKAQADETQVLTDIQQVSSVSCLIEHTQLQS